MQIAAVTFEARGHRASGLSALEQLRRGGHHRYSAGATERSRDEAPLPQRHEPGHQESGNDPLLRPFLAATDPGQAESALGGLLHEHARPLISRIVRHKAGESGARSRAIDREDVTADAIARVLERLTDLRAGREVEPIASFSGYLAVVAYNAWHHALRERFPNRTRLKNRLRYIASHHPRLAAWTDSGGALLCGLRAAPAAAASSAAAARLRGAVDDPAVFIGESGLGRNWRASGEAVVAAAAVQWAGGPVALNDLVELLAVLFGIGDDQADRRRDDDQEDVIEAVADPAPSILTTLDERDQLGRLWSEIRLLPVRQRAAILLNLRDGDGRGIIALLPLTATATIREIAEVLEMPAEELAALWRDLPLEDAAIAQRLGVTRQQVINFRKSARARLARRFPASADRAVVR